MTQPKDNIIVALKGLTSRGGLDPETLIHVLACLDPVIEEWRSDVIVEMERLIKDWETNMGDDDKTFYSLGLRRAIDIVTGKDAFSKLPILETPEYLPNEE
jgi:hypothetical protein